MAETGVIAERTQAGVGEVRAADVLIAVPTFNNEQTIASVLKAARAALLQFPQRKALIAQVDGGSSDSTMQRAKDSLGADIPFAQVTYPVYPGHKLEISHHMVPGKDSAYQTIFALAEEVDAKACCIVGVEGVIQPDWVASLVRPVLDMEFDLAAPFYQRKVNDGLLVNGMLYPAVRALFGRRIRQPIGSDFGYSRALIRRCLSSGAWNSETARRDIDLWVTIQALQGDLKLCQIYLGRRSRSNDGVQDASSILAALAGGLFFEMERTAEFWQGIRGSVNVPFFGLRFDQDTGTETITVKSLIEAFRIGYRNLRDLWNSILPPATLLELTRMNRQSDSEFFYSDELWARTVYDFAIAHRLRSIGRDHLLRALTPLYMGWIASFLAAVNERGRGQVEVNIERLCLAYESEKPYLISRWRWPDRFTP
jgi:glycosyltransferase involved in cell wall biosynthesis